MYYVTAVRLPNVTKAGKNHWFGHLTHRNLASHPHPRGHPLFPGTLRSGSGLWFSSSSVKRRGRAKSPDLQNHLARARACEGPIEVRPVGPSLTCGLDGGDKVCRRPPRPSGEVDPLRLQIILQHSRLHLPNQTSECPSPMEIEVCCCGTGRDLRWFEYANGRDRPWTSSFDRPGPAF